MKSRLVKDIESPRDAGRPARAGGRAGLQFSGVVAGAGAGTRQRGRRKAPTALKLLGEQQRHPTLIRAALDSVHERLGDRGYVQESLDQLRASSSQLDAALHEMTHAAARGSWFALTADTGATGTPMAGKHAAQLLDNWARELMLLKPILAFQGVPYQDNESTGTALNDSGRELELRVNAALRTSRRAAAAVGQRI